MEHSLTRFLTFAAFVSLALLASGVPLQRKGVLTTNEAATLEAEDDPARLKRYQGYGLRQTKVQSVQPASNVHPDAAPFIDTPDVSSNAATGAEARPRLSQALAQREGRITSQETETALAGGTGASAGTSGTTKVDNQLEAILPGHSERGNAITGISGPASWTLGGTRENTSESASLPSSARMSSSPNGGSILPAKAGSSTFNMVNNGTVNTSTALSAARPTTGTLTMTHTATLKEQSDHRSSPAVKSAAAENILFTGKETTLAQQSEGLNERGSTSSLQRSVTPERASGNGATGLYVVHKDGV